MDKELRLNFSTELRLKFSTELRPLLFSTYINDLVDDLSLI